MDIQQAAKTIQWLDEERRRDKKEQAALQERVNLLQQELAAQTRRLQGLEAGLAAVPNVAPRLNKLEELIAQSRAEAARQLEAVEHRLVESDHEAEKLRVFDRDNINRLLVELRKTLEPLPAKLDQEIQGRKEDENRVSRILIEIQQKLIESGKQEEDRMRALAAVEEGRKIENRRIAEVQVEVAELKRKLDEHRGKYEVVEDLVRRNDSRIAEVVAVEAERRVLQQTWMERQSLVDAERDKRWNEWELRFTTLQAQAEEFYRRVESYAEIYRSLRRLPEEVQATAERIERRVNEGAELQRLAEERVRQEWAAFLADDQKRWTTHMLLRDEQWRENDRLMQKVTDRLAALEEQLVELQDAQRLAQEAEASRIMGLMALVRDWVAEHEQAFARVK